MMARMNFSGSLGAATGKRIFLPLSLFAAGSHNPFTSSSRLEPIDLRYPYTEEDEVTVHLPPGMQVDSVPEHARVDLPQMAVYVSVAKSSGQTITFNRSFIVANTLYAPNEYTKLKTFLDEVSTKDRAPAVLRPAAAATGQ